MSVIAVTGASGFIGGHLVTRLVAGGHAVRAVSRAPASGLEPHRSADWVRVTDPWSVDAWRAAIGDCDVVVHLAGLAHLAGPAGRGRLDEFLRANAELAHTLGRAMVATGRPMRLVFMSSVGAVASFAETPLTDETEPRPDSDYGRSKLAGERAVIQVLRSTCVDWCILRPPLVYGPGDRGNLQRLAALIRKGCPLPLGAIRSRRSFVYVGNLVDAIERCATAAAASRRTYFVADDEQTSLVELMEGIGREMGRPARIVSVPLPVLRAGAALFEFVSEFRGKSVGLDRYAFERLTGSLVVDSSSLQRELAWRPPYTMQSGLCATFSHGT